MSTTPQIPARADVAIIGGGVIGCATAFWLARAGVSVALFEKGRVGGEQSGRNWGWIRRIGRDPSELELSARALRLWPELEEKFGVRAGFVNCGIAYLCRTERDMARRLAWFRKHGKDAGSDIRILGARRTAALFPQAAASFAGALHSPGDGRAEPREATEAFAAAARRAGARIVENCAVREVEKQAGRVSAVITEHGRTACQAAVLAGGVWSRMMCDRLGLRLPQLGVINSVQRTAPLGRIPDITASDGGYAFRRAPDGGAVLGHGSLSETLLTFQHLRFARDFLPILAGEWRNLPPRPASPLQPWAARASWKEAETTPFERTRILTAAPSRRILAAAMTAAGRDFPAFRSARIVSRWASVIDALPDAVPVMDAPAAIPGLVIATGFSGHGFGLAPAAGELVAALVTGKKPAVDPAPFAFRRLAR